MSSTATALAISANVQAAAAEAEASAAKTIACKKFVVGYQHDTATPESIHQYVECAERLYPQETSVPILVKAGIVACLVGITIGVVMASREGEDWAGHVVGGIFGFAGGFVAWLLAVMVVALFN